MDLEVVADFVEVDLEGEDFVAEAVVSVAAGIEAEVEGDLLGEQVPDELHRALQEDHIHTPIIGRIVDIIDPHGGIIVHGIIDGGIVHGGLDITTALGIIRPLIWGED